MGRGAFGCRSGSRFPARPAGSDADSDPGRGPKGPHDPDPTRHTPAATALSGAAQLAATRTRHDSDTSPGGSRMANLKCASGLGAGFKLDDSERDLWCGTWDKAGRGSTGGPYAGGGFPDASSMVFGQVRLTLRHSVEPWKEAGRQSRPHGPTWGKGTSWERDVISLGEGGVINLGRGRDQPGEGT
jgi:hypothetical protein